MLLTSYLLFKSSWNLLNFCSNECWVTGVLVRRVIDREVRDHAYAARVRFRKQRVEVGQRPVRRLISRTMRWRTAVAILLLAPYWRRRNGSR
jgi:CRISPR/Cas system-associated protein Cas5 (RAMP superfamily)